MSEDIQNVRVVQSSAGVEELKDIRLLLLVLICNAVLLGVNSLYTTALLHQDLRELTAAIKNQTVRDATPHPTLSPEAAGKESDQD